MSLEVGRMTNRKKATWPRKWPFYKHGALPIPGDGFRALTSHEVDVSHNHRHSDRSVRVLRRQSRARTSCLALSRTSTPTWSVERRSGASPVSPSKSTCRDRDSGQGQVGIEPGSRMGRMSWGSGESSVWGVWRTAVREQALTLGCCFQTSSTVVGLIF